MRPGAFAGIDTVATIHPVSSMLIASMRPGRVRRDRRPPRRAQGMSESGCFNEARRESPGSQVGRRRIFHPPGIASMRPGANRRELAASAVREMRTDRAAGVPARRAVGGSLISQGLLEGVCVTVTSAVDVATMTDANNRYE